MRNLILSLRLAPIALAMLLAISPAARADFVPAEALVTLNLQGNTETSIWTNLSGFERDGVPGLTGTGGFPGTTMWGPQNSQSGGGNGQLVKVSNGPAGGPYGAGQGIYYGGYSADINFDGGTLGVQDTSPVADLQQVAFQIQIGEAWGYDFFNQEAPVLSFQHAGGNEIGLVASVSQVLDRFYNGTIAMPTGDEDVYINTYLYDWDLSAYSDITDFEIQWTGVQHAQLYALQLDQGSIYTSLNSDPTAVPEPSTMILLGSCALFGIPAEIRRRRKLNQAQNSPADSPQA